MTRLHTNALFNLGGQIASAALGALCIPAYLYYLGIEAYGLVGFYLSLQMLSVLADPGLSLTVNRELAVLSAREGSANDMHALVRSLSLASWCLALTLGGIFVCFAPLVAAHWLHSSSIPREEVVVIVRLMGAVLCVQWPLAFYAGAINGLQRQVALNIINFTASLLRHPGTVLLLWLWPPTMRTFFLSQLLASAYQTLAVACLLWLSLPPRTTAEPGRIAWVRLRQFAGGITAINVIGVLLTQTDKIVLSYLLPLELFGAYTVASTAASSLYNISNPVFAALFPRLAQLVSSDRQVETRVLYHQAAQCLAVLLLPPALLLICQPHLVLLTWTNNSYLAERAAWVLRFLAVGTTINGLLTIPYALQLAHHSTRLALTISAASLAVFIPLVILLGLSAGGEGAALAWLLLNLGVMCFGLPFVFQRLLPGELIRWYRADVFLPLLPPLAIHLALLAFPEPSARFAAALYLAVVLLTSFIGSALVVPLTRDWGIRLIGRVFSALRSPRCRKTPRTTESSPATRPPD